MSYSFDMQRSIVLDVAHANRRVEDETVKATEKRVFAQVRAHERQLRHQSKRHSADALTIQRRIERLEAAIHAEITEPFERSAVTEEPVSLAESAQR